MLAFALAVGAGDRERQRVGGGRGGGARGGLGGAGGRGGRRGGGGRGAGGRGGRGVGGGPAAGDGGGAGHGDDEGVALGAHADVAEDRGVDLAGEAAAHDRGGAVGFARVQERAAHEAVVAVDPAALGAGLVDADHEDGAVGAGADDVGGERGVGGERELDAVVVGGDRDVGQRLDAGRPGVDGGGQEQGTDQGGHGPGAAHGSPPRAGLRVGSQGACRASLRGEATRARQSRSWRTRS
ncbi:MAG: hypothetical protein H6705_15285 [Myxococcales bacterium]|nr:hypothetical protein [Myxococcales bacterium]